jgi:hypothetical protein
VSDRSLVSVESFVAKTDSQKGFSNRDFPRRSGIVAWQAMSTFAYGELEGEDELMKLMRCRDDRNSAVGRNWADATPDVARKRSVVILLASSSSR